MPTEPTINELKAHAYDCLAQIEMFQRELQATNQKIAELSKPVPAKKAPDGKP